jgi:hypothetical protein
LTKEIITHPLIEESKMFQERYDTDEKISFCISYFDHWSNIDEFLPWSENINIS